MIEDSKLACRFYKYLAGLLSDRLVQMTHHTDTMRADYEEKLAAQQAEIASLKRNGGGGVGSRGVDTAVIASRIRKSFFEHSNPEQAGCVTLILLGL